VALVIGNNYRGEQGELKSCFNDADGMEQALKAVGFEVTKHYDLNKSDFTQELRHLRDSVGPGDTALLYFSGHGTSIGGTNFFIPTNMPKGLSDADDYDEEAISVPKALVMLSKKGAKFKFLIADACRSRPTSDATVHAAVKGTPTPKLSFASLQQSSLASNTYVAYSSGEATVSFAGGASDMSVFTKQLVPLLTVPEQELATLGRKLQKAVRVASGDKMICEKTDKMEDEFYFV
jgi:hypothetical protein